VADYSQLSEAELKQKLEERALTMDRTVTIDKQGDDWQAALRYEGGAIDRGALNVDRKTALVHLLQALDLHDELDRHGREQ
jgi:hypothetical protein